MAKLTDKFKNPTAPLVKPSEPLWKGPESNDKYGGITFSMLSRWLCCRERFRLYALEGIRTRDQFNSAIEYGNIWHEGEEAHAANGSWQEAIANYTKKLTAKYSFSREEIDHWYRMAMTQFPVYVDYWSKHQDVEDRTPLLQEQVFDVPYKLPSGRTVRLRGKWDAVDLVGSGKTAGIYIQENKTKSQIDQQKIARMLSCDLQSMMYMVALERFDWATKYDLMSDKSPLNVFSPSKIKGVRYNVIRRSAHKSPESMYKKMTEDIADNRGGEWFSRWKVDITPADVENFKQRTLNPILEQLCLWYEHVTGASSRESPFNVRAASDDYMIHWQSPYGVYNVLNEGGIGDLDGYIQDGSMVGLRKVTELFTELDE